MSLDGHPGLRRSVLGALADALGVLRLGLAAVFPAALGIRGWWALAIFVVAAASDFVDGPLARRTGRATRYGAVLDNTADIAFVLAGTASGAAHGLVSWIVPASIGCSAAAYALASLSRSRVSGAPVRAYSALGHAAGVANYAVVGLVAGSVALAGPAWTAILAVAGAIVAVLNLAAVANRLRPAPRAGASRA